MRCISLLFSSPSLTEQNNILRVLLYSISCPIRLLECFGKCQYTMENKTSKLQLVDGRSYHGIEGYASSCGEPSGDEMCEDSDGTEFEVEADLESDDDDRYEFKSDRSDEEDPPMSQAEEKHSHGDTINTLDRNENKFAQQDISLIDEWEAFEYMESTINIKDSENVAIEKVVRGINRKDPMPHPEQTPSFISGDILDAIAEIKALLAQRPVATIRFIKHKLQHLSSKQVKVAVLHCGYRFKNGPWQRAIIRFGYDPRCDTKSSIHQTLVFNMDFRPIIEDNPQNRNLLSKTPNELKALFPRILPGPENVPYIFDGTKFMTEDNVWQICDLHDSTLRIIADSPALSSSLSWKSGWFRNGTMAKLLIIMDDKLSRVKDNRSPHGYERLLHIPDNYTSPKWDGKGYGLGRGQVYTKEEWELRHRILKMARELQ